MFVLHITVWDLKSVHVQHSWGSKSELLKTECHPNTNILKFRFQMVKSSDFEWSEPFEYQFSKWWLAQTVYFIYKMVQANDMDAILFLDLTQFLSIQNLSLRCIVMVKKDGAVRTCPIVECLTKSFQNVSISDERQLRNLTPLLKAEQVGFLILGCSNFKGFRIPTLVIVSLFFNFVNKLYFFLTSIFCRL